MPEDSLTITVSDQPSIDWIREKVRRGHFDTVAEAVREGISRLREEDEDFAPQVIDIVAKRYDQLREHPETAIPIKQVVTNLEARRMKRVRSTH